jgi:hypothetical protein
MNVKKKKKEAQQTGDQLDPDLPPCILWWSVLHQQYINILRSLQRDMGSNSYRQTGRKSIILPECSKSFLGLQRKVSPYPEPLTV